MRDYVDVPLRDAESALPIVNVVMPEIAYASSAMTKIEYQVVRIDDSSQYETVPMRFVDLDAVSKSSI